MANEKTTEQAEVSIVALDDLLYAVEDPGGTPTSRKITLARLAGLLAPVSQLRLTTESGIPVSTSDRSAQGTLYLTPAMPGTSTGLIRLFDGTRHIVRSISEISLSLTGLLTNAKPHDIFLDDDGATLSVLAWTNDTTRASALAAEGSLLVLGSDHTKTYLGTCYASGTGTIEDTAAKRWVWNAYNRARRSMLNATETANSWTYTTAAFRQANANVANQLDYVDGLGDGLIEVEVCGIVSNSSSATNVAVGIGIDSTTVNAAQIFGTNTPASSTLALLARATYNGHPGLGRHAVAWLEYSTASGTTTWYGDIGLPTVYQTGITGVLWN